MKIKFLINILFIISFAALFFISACDDTSNITEIDSVTIPSQNVSYSQHIQPVLTAKCARAGCHDDQTASGGLSLTSYSSTTASYLVVAPGYPQSSSLVTSVQGMTTRPMPPVGFPPLITNQIDGIKTWVKEGAKNN
ncbi:MAG: hypothetical protein CVV24_03410 [Ignavibacteriae bacterium HGW-Ignavibacteriae-3]|nr:MAG: hypothetical protein CVV24_03410 [Ignavibacteriae bacterium HGW-Ignavibacteriae-3]